MALLLLLLLLKLQNGVSRVKRMCATSSSAICRGNAVTVLNIHRPSTRLRCAELNHRVRPPSPLHHCPSADIIFNFVSNGRGNCLIYLCVIYYNIHRLLVYYYSYGCRSVSIWPDIILSIGTSHCCYYYLLVIIPKDISDCIWVYYYLSLNCMQLYVYI